MKKIIQLALMVFLALFPLVNVLAANLQPGVTMGYDGGDVGATPGYIQLNGTYNPGQIVSFPQTDGMGIHGGSKLYWNNGTSQPVHYVYGVGVFPDGSRGRVLLYNLDNLTQDNGYLLVAHDPAHDNVPDWVAALSGDPQYVSLNLSFQGTISSLLGSWEVANLSEVATLSGGAIKYYNGASQNQFEVNSDGTTATPINNIIPTPPPTSSISIDNPNPTVGQIVTITNVANVYAASTAYHMEAIYVTGPNNYMKWIVGTDVNFPYYGTQFTGAAAVPGGGSGDPNSPKTYNEQQFFDTTGLTPGTYTVHYVLYDGVARKSTSGSNGSITTTFNLQAATQPVGPSISFSPSSNVTLTGGTAQPLSYTTSGWQQGYSVQITPAGSAINTWSAANDPNQSDTFTETENPGKGQTASVSYTANLMDSTGKIIATAKSGTITWTGPLNTPPVAKINAPDLVKAGDEFYISGLSSYDPDGTITDYSWSVPIVGGSGTIWYGTTGTYDINLTVTDDVGDTGSTSHTIKVIDPTPIAQITTIGTLKENRKVSIDSSSSYSPKHYPIDPSKTKWTITPISGQADNSTLSAGIKYVGSLDGNMANDILFKLQGTYQISLTVTNTAGYSDITTKTITIEPDQPPNALFESPNVVLRDPNNSNWASITIYDKAYSPDGDYIGKSIWRFAYDTNNNGNFSDDQWATIDDSTLIIDQETTLTLAGYTYKISKTVDTKGNKLLIIKTTQVGNYQVEHTVTEKFGQPTIEQFISEVDYRSGSYKD